MHSEVDLRGASVAKTARPDQMTFNLGDKIAGLLLGGAVAAFIALAQASYCQTVQTSDRADVARSQQQIGPNMLPSGAPGGAAPSSPNDADLGEQQILKRQEEYQPFSISVACPIYWTSNVALTRDNEQDDVLEAPSAGYFYQPQITRTLYGLIDVRDQQFYYNRFDELDFGAFDVDAGITWILPKAANLTLRAQYNYDRLTMKDSFASFFQNHNVIVSAELPVKIGRAQQVTFGTGATVSVAAIPDGPRRNDYDLYVGYSVNLTRALNLNAVGRVAVRDYYHEHSRVDSSEILSLTATYNVTHYFAASALSSFAANESNHDIFEYKVGNVGGAFALTVKF